MSESDFENEYSDLFGLDKSASEIKRKQISEEIESMLDKTIVRSVRSTGRAPERSKTNTMESSSQLVKINKNGIVTYQDGTSSKEEMLSLLDPSMDDSDELEMTEYAVKRLKKQMKAAALGPITAVAMICTGEKCQVNTTCPYWKANIAPIGEECLVEKTLIREWVERYVDEFQVDLSRTTEVHLVSELAELSVYERRINSYIAIHNPMMMQENVSGVDQYGNPFYNLDISKAFEIKGKLKQQRMKILDAMLATRDRKAKLVVAAANVSSNLTELSSLKQRIHEMAKLKNERVIDAE